jgi:hypothetical protein
VLDQDLGRVALLVEQARLGEEGDKGPRLCQHLVELVVLDDDLGRVEIEVERVQLGTGPAGEVAVEVRPLVVESRLGRVGVHFETLLGGQAPNRSFSVVLASSSPGSSSKAPSAARRAMRPSWPPGARR